MIRPDPSAKTRSRSAADGTGPASQLKRLEEHRNPLFVAAWEATCPGLSAAAVHKLTGARIAPGTIAKWLGGQYSPRLDYADLLAKALGWPDLLAWLEEGVLHCERLRQAARNVECVRDRRKAHRRALEKARSEGAREAIAEHFQALSGRQRQALLRRLEKLNQPKP